MAETKVNKLLLEKLLISKLLTDTVDLIHCTKVIKVIKKLVVAYEILDLNQKIFKKFNDGDSFCWDKGAISDLSHISKELVVFHRMDFNPEHRIVEYKDSVTKLVNCIEEADRIYNK